MKALSLPAGRFPRFLLLYLPAAALLTGLVLHDYRAQSTLADAQLRAKEIQAVAAAEQGLTRRLSGAGDDLRFLARAPALREALERPSPLALARLNATFAALAASRAAYLRIAWLDPEGRELASTAAPEGANGRPAAAVAKRSPEQQDILRLTRGLKAGEIYVSPLEPQEEEATLHLATPVMDGDERRGVLLLDYRGQELLDHYQALVAPIGDHAFLADAQGLRLREPLLAAREGSVAPPRANSLGQRYPEAWRRISVGSRGQFETVQGLWTFASIMPLADAGPGSALAVRSYPWKVAALLPADRYRPAARGRAMGATGFLAGLLLLLAFGVGHYTALQRERQRSRDYLARLEREVEHLAHARATAHAADLRTRRQLEQRQLELMGRYQDMLQTAAEDSARPLPAAARPWTLLLVDDERPVLNSLQRLFRPPDFRVLLAASGMEGLEILDREPVDLIVADMCMPHMNGARFLELACQRRPDTIRILLTAYANAEATRDAIHKGQIYRYFAKPWDDEELLRTVSQALEFKQLDAEKSRLEALTLRQNAELKALNHHLQTLVMERTEELQQALNDMNVARGSQERADYLAHHDVLTGLPNRLLLATRMEHAIEQAKRRHGLLAVLFIDLDNFKPVNDRLGHNAGDALLQDVAHRMQQALRAEDTVARFGGDEFVVLIENVDNEAAALQVAAKLQGVFPLSVEGDGLSFSVNASIGMSFFPRHGDSPSQLIACADEAMYQAKAGGRAALRLYRESAPASAAEQATSDAVAAG